MTSKARERTPSEVRDPERWPDAPSLRACRTLARSGFDACSEGRSANKIPVRRESARLKRSTSASRRISPERGGVSGLVTWQPHCRLLSSRDEVNQRPTAKLVSTGWGSGVMILPGPICSSWTGISARTIGPPAASSPPRTFDFKIGHISCAYHSSPS